MANLDLKVVFSDNNIKNLPNDTCGCPNTLDVLLTNLVVGRKYTVALNNINTTPVRIFPSSFSFTAEEVAKKLTYYYQFN